MDEQALLKAVRASRDLGIPCVVIVGGEPLVVADVAVFKAHQAASVSDSEAVPIPLPDPVRPSHEVQGLTEEDLFDKINRDIAVWREHHNQEALPETEESLAKPTFEEPILSGESEEQEARPLQEYPPESGRDQQEERFYIEPVE